MDRCFWLLDPKQLNAMSLLKREQYPKQPKCSVGHQERLELPMRPRADIHLERKGQLAALMAGTRGTDPWRDARQDLRQAVIRRPSVRYSLTQHARGVRTITS